MNVGTETSLTVNLSVGTIEEMREICKVMANSDAVPKDYRGKPDSIFGAVIFGKEVGLGFMQSLSNIANINGRPSIWGDAGLALVEGSGLLEDFEEWYEIDGEKTEDDEKVAQGIESGKEVVARCMSKRKGRGRPVTRSFSMGMAKKAGLLGKETPWKGYPARMLQFRARGFSIRDNFPDVLKGLIFREEAQDIEMTKDNEGVYAATETTDNGSEKKPLAERMKKAKVDTAIKEVKIEKSEPPAQEGVGGELPAEAVTEVKAKEAEPTTVSELEQVKEAEAPKVDVVEEKIETILEKERLTTPAEDELMRTECLKLIHELNKTKKGGAILGPILKDAKIKDLKNLSDDPAVLKGFRAALEKGVEQATKK